MQKKPKELRVLSAESFCRNVESNAQVGTVSTALTMGIELKQVVRTNNES